MPEAEIGLQANDLIVGSREVLPLAASGTGAVLCILSRFPFVALWTIIPWQSIVAARPLRSSGPFWSCLSVQTVLAWLALISLRSFQPWLSLK